MSNLYEPNLIQTVMRHAVGRGNAPVPFTRGQYHLGLSLSSGHGYGGKISSLPGEGGNLYGVSSEGAGVQGLPSEGGMANMIDKPAPERKEDLSAKLEKSLREKINEL
jgi:hypothetical protein